MSLRKLIVIFLLQLMVIGCAGNRSVPLPLATSSANPEKVTLLYEQYKSWQGVRHKDGGLSRDGVDCSGFVYLTYQEKFGQTVPRTTQLLVQTGKPIDPRNMRPGDLVFFKTGWKKRHVGIYVNDGKFLHASSSRGVMMSELQNPYWSDAFWMARRY